MDDTNSQAFVSLLNGLMMKCGAVMFKDKVQGTAFRVGPSYVLTAFHVIKDIATGLDCLVSYIKSVFGNILITYQ
jgi:hypothetical protein